MKKPIFILTLLVSVFMLSCTKEKKDKNSENTLHSGYIKIAVDETMANVMRSETEVFEGLYPAKIDVVYAPENDAVKMLLEDSVRLAVTARPLSAQELKYLRDKTFRPNSIRIAIDAVAVIIHPSNPDSIINVQNLKRILTGEVKNWNQIYPSSTLGNIQVVFDNTNSSIVRYIADSVCRDKPLSKNLNALNLNREVVEYISKTPNAMGLIGVSLISNEYDSISQDFNKKIQVMRVSTSEHPDRTNSVQPYQYYMYTMKYPLTRDIYILLNDPRGELPKGFTNFVAGDKGQRIILRAGLLPVTMPVNKVVINRE
ncbi:MAG: PstS family phosphate ABC transporter substrate-binding protein [Paludibacteraceae bacterium]